MTATDDRNGQEPPGSSIRVLPIVVKKLPYEIPMSTPNIPNLGAITVLSGRIPSNYHLEN